MHTDEEERRLGHIHAVLLEIETRLNELYKKRVQLDETIRQVAKFATDMQVNALYLKTLPEILQAQQHTNDELKAIHEALNETRRDLIGPAVGTNRIPLPVFILTILCIFLFVFGIIMQNSRKGMVAEIPGVGKVEFKEDTKPLGALEPTERKDK